MIVEYRKITRDEILAMEPGREVDALVAEKVMGWTNNNGWWTDAESNVRYYDDTIFLTENDEVWNPSENIKHAWEVVEKLQGNYLVSLYANPKKVLGERFTVHISKTSMGRNFVEIDSNEAPEAICKATLLAVMDQTSETAYHEGSE